MLLLLGCLYAVAMGTGVVEEVLVTVFFFGAFASRFEASACGKALANLFVPDVSRCWILVRLGLWGSSIKLSV